MNQNIEDDDIELIEIDLDNDGAEDDLDKDIAEDIDEGTDVRKKSAKLNKSGSTYILREILSYVLVAAISIVIAFTINRYVIINANIPTRSMVPTVNAGDKLFGFRMAYMFSEPQRGDVIIFNHQCYENAEEESLLKRVIGIEGDKVEIKDGKLYVNDKEVVENYLAEEMVGTFGPYIVPADSYFVMGDNRNMSDDSRLWDNTYVHMDEIQAKAIWKYSPDFDVIE